MRTKLLILTCMLMNVAYSGEPQDVTIRLDLHLDIHKECRDGDPLACRLIIRDSLSGGKKIVLSAHGSPITNCTSTGEVVTCSDTYDYRGIWSTVKEVDGVRTVAIVSVDRYTLEYNGTTNFNYTITVELLDEDGLSGKMAINTTDLKRLNGTTLMGRSITKHGDKYTPRFSVASPICPISSDGRVDCDTDISDPESKQYLLPEVDLILGSLR
jgi:hypothetical protein